MPQSKALLRPDRVATNCVSERILYRAPKKFWIAHNEAETLEMAVHLVTALARFGAALIHYLCDED